MPESSTEPLVSPLTLGVCIAFIAGASALANCSVLAALLKSSKNGLSSIIIQLAVADLILAASVAPEMWYYNNKSWNFGNSGCVAYRGLSIFSSTASSYFIATIALHSIAVVNVEHKIIQRRIERNSENEDEENIRSSHHSLVANSDTSTPPRTMNVDYRLTDVRVRATPPTLLVWILSASLSVPEFVLATTVHLRQGVTLCIAADSHHKLNMHLLLAAFNLFLPATLIIIAGVLVICQLKSKRKYFHMDTEMSKSIRTLKLSLWLLLVYGVFSAPRTIISVYRVYSKSFSEKPLPPFETEHLNFVTTAISLSFSGAYMVGALLRPLLSLLLLPILRKFISFSCCKSDQV